MNPNFRQSALRPPQSRHSLLLAMAADLERLHAQAERIRELREAKQRRDGKRISQETAAHAVGVSVRQYRTWESTGAVIQFDNLQALADYFETSTSFIQYGEHMQAETPDLSKPANIAEELAYLRERADQIHGMLTRLLGHEAFAGSLEQPPADQPLAKDRAKRAV